MAWTLADVRTYLADHNNGDTSIRTYRVYDRVSNEARLEISRCGNWDFDKRYGTLTFAAQYTTGTVAVTNGSTVLTGTGTTFLSGMAGNAGRYIRVAGQETQYRITAFTSTTVMAIESFQGTTATAQNYAITDERQAAPSRFRSLAGPLSDSIAYAILAPKPLEWIRYQRIYAKLVDVPRYYAVEWQEDTSVPTPYFWIYPAPSAVRIITLPYYVWPTEATAGTDVYRIPYEAQTVHQMFCLAFLFREQGKTQEYNNQLGLANEEASRALSTFRAVGEQGQRQEWDPSYDRPDAEAGPYTLPLAPGEPAYT